MTTDRELVASSGWFDAKYYAEQYPDTETLSMPPLEHFMWLGHRLRRNPCARFNTREYLRRNPGVAGNPLVHFLKSGGYLSQLPKSNPKAPTMKIAPDEIAPGTAIFISGEAVDRPGFLYRIDRWAKAFEKLGQQVAVMDHATARERLHWVGDARFIFVWRARYDDVREVYRAANSAKVPIIYDLDDLMVRADLATAQYIDAIRYDKRDPKGVQDHYLRIRRAMEEADFCTASTQELAWQMRMTPNRNPTFVLPNGFAHDTYTKSRIAARQKPNDGHIRIGYASGSRTHQADFKLCAAAVADVLRRYPQCRLVLFRRNTLVTLDLAEFPEFKDLQDRIEWRSFVKLEDLPNEIARFDINLAPLEAGNPFCECKSELKFFEAGICDVPTIASPTGPFARAMKHGESGFLASSMDEWRQAIERLVKDPEQRQKIGREAHRKAIWQFGPVYRTEIAASLLDQLRTGRKASRAAHFAEKMRTADQPIVPLVDRRIIKDHHKRKPSRVTVIIPLYNYEKYIEEALDSVAKQTLPDLDLVVVDDCSTDESAQVAEKWIDQHSSRFNRAILVRHTVNSGLGNSRNTAFDVADTPYVMCLDADNRLRSDCCARLLETMELEGASFAYSSIQKFGDADGLMGDSPYLPASLVPGNYIDAMAMVSKEAWAYVGGYPAHRMGWQDFHFWCRITDRGLHGVHVPTVLSDYRVHGNSMLKSTNKTQNKKMLCDQLETDFTWLGLIDQRTGYRVHQD
ncbi:glycosyltransferase [Nitratireductor aquimarinus]|uniref:Glycosyltransferase n=1 Tax=Nitratireductor aquimarinus TaxID=889300 RepID=A0ABU4ANJ9_9HYPH|nr:glycosyltransferase [Nitratireductor aquimarinus]MDV6227809.1 glycosyltransferase [Nitratireductor aquimarinus]